MMIAPRNAKTTPVVTKLSRCAKGPSVSVWDADTLAQVRAFFKKIRRCGAAGVSAR
jgi:hypothetical protein